MPAANPSERDVRISLPSKGRLAGDALSLLTECGLHVDKPNPRQYAATIPALPGLTVSSSGRAISSSACAMAASTSASPGSTWWRSRRRRRPRLLVLHDALGFGRCRLAWPCRRTGAQCARMRRSDRIRARLPHPLRVATHFPQPGGAVPDAPRRTNLARGRRRNAGGCARHRLCRYDCRPGLVRPDAAR